MGNFARKIIDAVQNLMLDRLLLRSVPLWWIASLWDERQTEYGPGFMLPMLFALFVLFGLGWILGVVANNRPRAIGPLERLHETPSNGFEAWSEPPAGGLRPPSLLRWIVMNVGRRGRGADWTALVGFAGFLSAFVLLWLLANQSKVFWSELHPALAIPSVQDALWIGATAVIVFMVFRHWAGEQRSRLEPPEDRRESPQSDWAPFFMLSVLAVTLTALVSISFHWPGWSAAVPLLPLGVVGLVPGWRRAFNNAMFGKQIEPAARQPEEPSPN